MMLCLKVCSLEGMLMTCRQKTRTGYLWRKDRLTDKDAIKPNSISDLKEINEEDRAQ